MNIDVLMIAIRWLIDKDVINRPIVNNGYIELVLADNSVVRIKAKPLAKRRQIKGENDVR